MKIDIKSMDKGRLEDYVTGTLGEKKYRAGQLYSWMHKKLAPSFDQMSDIPARLRQRLEDECTYTSLKIVRRYVSGIDGTVKYLFELADGNIIESVLMQYKHGYSVCISSQVGCRMGCRFCASTLDGLQRQMTVSEMLDEVYSVQRDSGHRISNIVVMGTGEPLDNYDHLLGFIGIVCSPDGLNISQRNITVSTCGLVPRIRELADEKLQITLAISLHAASDRTRQSIMPIARAYSIDQILDACSYYIEKTGRRITFEYSLISGVNDSDSDARQLADLLSSLNCHINLIPVNPIKERSYRQSVRAQVARFKSILEKNGRNVTIRREMGRDIQAACGQLRKQYADSQERQS